MKRITIIFTAVILLLCLVPSAGMALLGPSAARANEIAPAEPELFSRDGEFNAELLSDTAEYLDESFYLRQELITLWARVKALFGQSTESGVVLGSDGWLYYADELADFTGTEPLSERELFAAARNLALMSEYVEGLGARFVFTIAPNKSSLYPEHMPELARSGAATDAERLAEALEAEGVEYLDLFELFRSRSETLYFEHDSHWTSRGAALAADAINSALGAASAYGGGYEYETRQHTGDLYEMLYPAGTDRETDDVPTALGFSQGEGIRPDSITIDTTGSGSGSLLMFRDSFGELLYPFMAASWAEARFSRQSVYDLTTAAELGSDAVVVELVERNLFWLCEQRAVFPAPERSLDAAGAQPGSASLALDDGPEGYHHLYGTVGDGIDADSPVYIAYNGTYYEALIASEDFSATLPGSGGGEYGVYWYSDGILTRADLSI